MKKVVIDTNIVVSAALVKEGKPARILNLISDSDGEIQVFYSVKMMAEYKEVLSRERFHIAAKIQSGIIGAIEKSGTLINPPASDMALPDESDRVFYDTAKESGSVLITGNMKHYPAEEFIMTPAEYLLRMELLLE